jgi:hypothetical protein
MSGQSDKFSRERADSRGKDPVVSLGFFVRLESSARFPILSFQLHASVNDLNTSSSVGS